MRTGRVILAIDEKEVGAGDLLQGLQIVFGSLYSDLDCTVELGPAPLPSRSLADELANAARSSAAAFTDTETPMCVHITPRGMWVGTGASRQGIVCLPIIVRIVGGTVIGVHLLAFTAGEVKPWASPLFAAQVAEARRELILRPVTLEEQSAVQRVLEAVELGYRTGLDIDRVNDGAVALN